MIYQSREKNKKQLKQGSVRKNYQAEDGKMIYQSRKKKTQLKQGSVRKKTTEGIGRRLHPCSGWTKSR